MFLSKILAKILVKALGLLVFLALAGLGGFAHAASFTETLCDLKLLKNLETRPVTLKFQKSGNLLNLGPVFTKLLGTKGFTDVQLNADPSGKSEDDLILGFKFELKSQSDVEKVAQVLKASGLESSETTPSINLKDAKFFLTTNNPFVGPSNGNGGIVPPFMQAKIRVGIQVQDYLKASWGHFSDQDRAGITAFLNGSVFADPEFTANPSGFLSSWTKLRGGSEMLIVTEDPAMEFLIALAKDNKLAAFASEVKLANFQKVEGYELLSSRWKKTSTGLSEDEQAKSRVLTEVEKYLNTAWDHFEGRQKKAISDFLDAAVWADPEFVKNPNQYLAAWLELRGGTEMLNTVEDPALQFLEKLAAQKGLEAFAKDVALAGFKPVAGVEVLSLRWKGDDKNKSVGNDDGIPPNLKSQIQKTARDFFGTKWAHYSETGREHALAFLEASVFPDPLFIANTEKYLVDWKEARSGLHDLRIEDVAFDFMVNLYREQKLAGFVSVVKDAGYTQADASLLHSAKFKGAPKSDPAEGSDAAVMRRAEVKKQMSDYVEKEWSHMDAQTRAGIISFLETEVLPDSTFQTKPEAYLSSWIRARGGLEMLVMPDDAAQSFLEELYRTKKLVEFAKNARIAGYRSDNPSKLQSAKWVSSDKASSENEAEKLKKIIGDQLQNYVDTTLSYTSAAERQMVRNFLENSILGEQLFQENPHGYLRLWDINRNSGGNRSPYEAPAMLFLDTLNRFGALGPFAEQVKKAGYPVPQSPASIHWTRR